MTGVPTKLSSQFRLTYNMILNILRTDIAVTSMMARSYAEFATQVGRGEACAQSQPCTRTPPRRVQTALVGRNAPRLLALGAGRLTRLRAQVSPHHLPSGCCAHLGGGAVHGSPPHTHTLAATLQLDSVPCIRRSTGDLDSGVLDLEEAHTALGTPATRATSAVLLDDELARNEPFVGGAHALLQDALQAHGAYLRKLCGGGGGKVVGQVFAAGRVVVLAEVDVPVQPGDVASSGAAAVPEAAKTLTCYHVPAVVLDLQVRGGAPWGCGGSGVITAGAGGPVGQQGRRPLGTTRRPPPALLLVDRSNGHAQAPRPRPAKSASRRG